MLAQQVRITEKQSNDPRLLSPDDASLRLRIAGVVPESTVDGPGYRYVVFTQGCPHHCEGCHNPETHDFSAGYLTSVSRLLTLMQRNPLLAGVTISGGEPFCQPDACAALARGAREAELHVIVYTGYKLEALQAMENEAVQTLLSAANWLVDGRFVQEKRTRLRRFVGSANQRIIDLPETFSSGKIQLVEE